MRALQIIQSAYRCTIEEQDDPAVWITQAMAGAGAELGVLLRGNAVCYAVEGQDASGLRFGALAQRHPPRIERDVAQLVSKGIAVYVVEEDARARGLAPESLVAGVRPVSSADLARVFSEYEQLWHW